MSEIQISSLFYRLHDRLAWEPDPHAIDLRLANLHRDHPAIVSELETARLAAIADGAV